MNAKKYLGKRGQSIVELTLIVPLLLSALYVAMDFGIMFFTTHYAQNAVREASRIGSIMPDCAIPGVVAPCVTTVTGACSGATDTVILEACKRLPTALTGASVTVTLTGVYDPPTCMREVRVAASGTYNYGLYRAIALFGLAVPTNPVITRIATGRYQGQPVTVTGAC
jgi:Flp pilus assembly protein TadG